MARGRQPSPSQLMEELRMEIQAVAMDLVVHDRWEMYALREVRRIADGRGAAGDGDPGAAREERGMSEGDHLILKTAAGIEKRRLTSPISSNARVRLPAPRPCGCGDGCPDCRTLADWRRFFRWGRRIA